MTREEVAEQAGVDEETIEQLEQGELDLGIEALLAPDTAFAFTSWVPDGSGGRRPQLGDPPL